MRIAWFTPLNMAHRSGGICRSSYYSRTVAPILAEQENWEIEYFTDDADYDRCRTEGRYQGGVPTCGSIPVFHHLSAFLRHRNNPFDAFIYQIEDHPSCGFVRKVLRIFPGLVVFHDLTFDRMNYQSYPDDIKDCSDHESSDEVGVCDAETISKRDEWRMRGWSTEFSATDFQLEGGALANPIFIQAGVIAVRNAHAANEVRQNVVDAQIELCRFATPVVKDSKRGREVFRTHFRIDENEMVVGFDSRNLIEERGRIIVESLAPWVQASDLRSLLWIVSGDQALLAAQKFTERLSAELAVRCRVVSVENWEEFGSAISACDMWVSPRFDILHETPAGIPFAAARGIPIICSNFGPSGELPSSTIFLVEPGIAERRTIAACVDEISTNAELREGLERVLRTMSEELYDPANAACDLAEAIERSQAVLQKRLKTAEQNYNDATIRVRRILSDFAQPEILLRSRVEPNRRTA